jgi:hypothetical protein
VVEADGGAVDALGVTFHAAGVVVSGDGAVIENTQTGIIESKNAASAAVELNTLERAGLVNSATSTELDNGGLIKGASIAIVGDAGQETVVNHGQIVGDVVLGAGDDTFVFGKGGHVAGDVYLGIGNDHVVMEGGSGVSHIADLLIDDTVDVSAFFQAFNQLVGHIQQHGNDVVVTLDHNDALVLEHTQLANLHLHDVFQL